MYNEDVNVVCESAYKKLSFLKSNFLGYFISAVMAGIYVGFGVLIAYSIGGFIHNDVPTYKILMGLSFSVALSLVYFGGAELFTGNNFVMSMGAINKKVTWTDALKIWVVCYLGNLVGAIILTILTIFGGFLNEDIQRFIADYTAVKTSIPPIELIIRGILCNILVSLATWCGYRMKSESGKLIMVILCILTFFTTGFEHSIANMTLLFIGTLNPFDTGNTFGLAFYNISLATIGNIIGGVVFLAVPYSIIARQTKK